MFSFLKNLFSKQGDNNIIVQNSKNSTIIIQPSSANKIEEKSAARFIPADNPNLHADLTRLPKPATNQFIGRAAEFQQLQQAFENREKIGIVGLIAAGGIGKSALTDYWITTLKTTNYGGIKRVFAWSFYSQGSHQTTFTNSQAFFTVALPFFGFSGELPQDDIEKARELAKCLNTQPALLLLDGLEPLQHPIDTMGSEMADIGMKELLLCLHHHRHLQTFVLISSRQPIVELDNRHDYQAIQLDTLNDEDGAALLQALKVKGTLPERETVSHDLNGHALSLVLLATLLTQYHKGDVRYARELPPLDSDAKNGGHAKRVLIYYDSLLSDNERRFMHCLALFDRPMHWKEKHALFAEAELAKPLANLSEGDWQTLQENLENKGLLLKQPPPKNSNQCTQRNPHTQWDTHPLIRQFFANQLQQQQPQAFQQAHQVLFAYFQSVPEKPQPDTLEELEPLYRAVLHGCLAGEYQKAREDVFRKRIERGDEHYSKNKLGAYSQNLIAISAFFPQGWSQPVSSGLSEADQAWLLQAASFFLMSLGRLAEAVTPREATIKLYEKLEEWEYAANTAESLTDLLLPLGKLHDAETAARRAIDYALRTENKFQQIVSYSQLATVLHRLGQLEQAQSIFVQAEQLQQQDQPDYPYLYSLRGAQYCALLLDISSNSADLEQILKRAKHGLKISERNNWLSIIAFDHLTLPRTYQALQQPQLARAEFDLAVQGIQKAKSTLFMPEFYLARADFYLSQHELEKAKADIDTANQIIVRCGMKLYAVDAALSQARYHLALKDKKTATHFCEQAEMLIAETSYHLRDKALAELYKVV